MSIINEKKKPYEYFDNFFITTKSIHFSHVILFIKIFVF